MYPEFVYRVECKEGGGMYTGKNNLNDCVDYQYCRYVDNMDPRHPSPEWDLLSKSVQGWKFGFESIEALYTWLHKNAWIEYLDDFGYEISKYSTVEVVKQGKAQLVFNPLELIERIELSCTERAKFN